MCKFMVVYSKKDSKYNEIFRYVVPEGEWCANIDTNANKVFKLKKYMLKNAHDETFTIQERNEQGVCYELKQGDNVLGKIKQEDAGFMEIQQFLFSNKNVNVWNLHWQMFQGEIVNKQEVQERLDKLFQAFVI